MLRLWLVRMAHLLWGILLCMLKAEGQTVVADSLSRVPLGNVAVFDRHGKFAGTCSAEGVLPYVPVSDFPLTVRHIGFKEKTVAATGCDTVFLQESWAELPEVVVESRRKKMLHILAYVREYSTLSTYTDTVALFREKMVDFMLPCDRNGGYQGWRRPRVLASKSYYRFTDAGGLDSVSNRCSHHFTWSDWMGILPQVRIPPGLVGVETGTDTLSGKYSPSEIWSKSGGRITVDINVLADTASRKWVPNLSVFFNDDIDFEQFRLRLNYGNVAGDSIGAVDLAGYSFNIESNGRGHGMFRFNRRDEPFFVSTYAEVYVMDKEYISVKEAKKWDRRKFDAGAIEILEPADAPELQPSIQALVDRVDTIDNDRIRLSFVPDRRLAGRDTGNRNFKVGRRALNMLKQITGISMIKSHRNFNNKWSEFRKGQVNKNRNRDNEE